MSKDEYRQVFLIYAVFWTADTRISKNLEEEMRTASQNLEFERAAVLRDQIRAVREIEERQKAINTDKLERQGT